MLSLTVNRSTGRLSFTEKLHIIKVSSLFTVLQTCYLCDCIFISFDSCEQSLLKFVLPLGLVYFAEYFINQGLVSSLVPSSITFTLLYIRTIWFRVTGGMRYNLYVCGARLNADVAGDNTEPWVMQMFLFPDGTPVFPKLFPVPCWAVSLVSWSYLLSEGIVSFKLPKDLDFSVVHICVCTQVPDAVPDWSVGVSLLPVLPEDQETVGSFFATGEKKRTRGLWYSRLVSTQHAGLIYCSLVGLFKFYDSWLSIFELNESSTSCTRVQGEICSPVFNKKEASVVTKVCKGYKRTSLL